jgi:hypothetical protein
VNKLWMFVHLQHLSQSLPSFDSCSILGSMFETDAALSLTHMHESEVGGTSVQAVLVVAESQAPGAVTCLCCVSVQERTVC